MLIFFGYFFNFVMAKKGQRVSEKIKQLEQQQSAFFCQMSFFSWVNLGWSVIR